MTHERRERFRLAGRPPVNTETEFIFLAESFIEVELGYIDQVLIRECTPRVVSHPELPPWADPIELVDIRGVLVRRDNHGYFSLEDLEVALYTDFLLAPEIQGENVGPNEFLTLLRRGMGFQEIWDLGRQVIDGDIDDELLRSIIGS